MLGLKVKNKKRTNNVLSPHSACSKKYPILQTLILSRDFHQSAAWFARPACAAGEAEGHRPDAGRRRRVSRKSPKDDGATAIAWAAADRGGAGHGNSGGRGRRIGHHGGSPRGRKPVDCAARQHARHRRDPCRHHHNSRSGFGRTFQSGGDSGDGDARGHAIGERSRPMSSFNAWAGSPAPSSRI